VQTSGHVWSLALSETRSVTVTKASYWVPSSIFKLLKVERFMFLENYGLKEQPFGVSPDPRFLFPSATHREAFASLHYGVTSGRGFLALIAQPGMGKTTLLVQLLQRLRQHARTVFLFQTQSSPRDLLRNLLADLGISSDDGDLVRIHTQLNEILLSEAHAGRRFVLVIDEAQNLDFPVLEVVRMLSNFETPQDKLIQIILAGQLQLAAKLAAPRMVQLRQRLAIVARLKPLTPRETENYIQHRLLVAGYSPQTPLFTPGALAMIARHSVGIPRNINMLCFNALSLSCAIGKFRVDEEIMREVLVDQDLRAIAFEPSAPRTSASRFPDVPSGSARRKKGKRLLQKWIPRLAFGCVLVGALAMFPFDQTGQATSSANRVMQRAASPANSPSEWRSVTDQAQATTLGPRAAGNRTTQSSDSKSVQRDRRGLSTADQKDALRSNPLASHASEAEGLPAEP
jgi:type II secretory pathway predicted ATPase ExeA